MAIRKYIKVRGWRSFPHECSKICLKIAQHINLIIAIIGTYKQKIVQYLLTSVEIYNDQKVNATERILHNLLAWYLLIDELLILPSKAKYIVQYNIFENGIDCIHHGTIY